MILIQKTDYLITLFLLLIGIGFASAQTVTVSGFVFSDEEQEGLIGVNMLVQGTGKGTISEFDGTFTLELNAADLPQVIEITYTGYEDKLITITQAEPNLQIKMVSAAILAEEIVIKGQKVSEKTQKAALTIETLNSIAIKQTASENFYDGLGALKGVDLTSASLGIKVVNTRGFNSTAPVRILQTIDGVDNASPSVNFALGNFLGSTELDLKGVELIVGASSAFYGPNAFNGVIKLDSKDPFFSKGLSAFVKVGERSILETGIRYADAFNNKNGKPFLAYKVNFSYLSADDWEANNFSPIDSSRVEADHFAGFDAVNIHGDEYDGLFDLRNASPSGTRGLTLFFRNGYKEEELLEYSTENIKANISLNLRLKPELEEQSPELIWANNFSEGNTIFQGSARFRLLGVNYFTSRLEFRKRDKFFLRAYVTTDGVGDTYNPFATAQQLNESAKTNEAWANLYTSTWLQQFGPQAVELGYPTLEIVGGVPQPYDFEGRDAFFANPDIQDSLARWHALTTEIVNNTALPGGTAFLAPGTPEFQEEFDRITSTLTSDGGAKFFTASEVYHVQGEYKFEPDFVDQITVGGSYRLFTPDTRGTIFSDTTDLITIRNSEAGIYGGIEHSFLEDDLLTLSVTGRLDKNQNFPLVASPAASLVIKPSEKDFIRLSFSSAIRNPTLLDQFFNLDVGPAIFAGSVNGFDSLLTIESFEDFGFALNRDTLDFFNIDPIRPEKVKTFEIGYRSVFWDNVYFDASYYYSIYDDFLGFRVGLDLDFNELGLPGNIEVLRASANAASTVTTQGFALGFNYYFKKYYQLAGNYTFSRLNTDTDDEIIPAFNTPEHKFNFSLSGRNVPFNIGGFRSDNLGFNINYKYIEGFLFEGSPQFTGLVPTYGLLDVQLNYEFKNINTTLKIGASNILNNLHFETVGGPLVGRLAFAKLTYEFNKK